MFSSEEANVVVVKMQGAVFEAKDRQFVEVSNKFPGLTLSHSELSNSSKLTIGAFFANDRNDKGANFVRSDVLPIPFCCTSNSQYGHHT